MIYGSVADADAYFLTKRLDYQQVWAKESEANKQIVLEMATQAIERLNFLGEKADSTQELEFPRKDGSSVPEQIEHACYECAYMFLDGVDPEFEGEMESAVSGQFGPVRERKAHDYTPQHRLHGIPSRTAWRLLSPFLDNNRSIILSRVN
mgnify:CR=1 FL=1